MYKIFLPMLIFAIPLVAYAQSDTGDSGSDNTTLTNKDFHACPTRARDLNKAFVAVLSAGERPVGTECYKAIEDANTICSKKIFTLDNNMDALNKAYDDNLKNHCNGMLAAETDFEMMEGVGEKNFSDRQHACDDARRNVQKVCDDEQNNQPPSSEEGPGAPTADEITTARQATKNMIQALSVASKCDEDTAARMHTSFQLNTQNTIKEDIAAAPDSSSNQVCPPDYNDLMPTTAGDAQTGNSQNNADVSNSSQPNQDSSPTSQGNDRLRIASMAASDPRFGMPSENSNNSGLGQSMSRAFSAVSPALGMPGAAVSAAANAGEGNWGSAAFDTAGMTAPTLVKSLGAPAAAGVLDTAFSIAAPIIATLDPTPSGADTILPPQPPPSATQNAINTAINRIRPY